MAHVSLPVLQMEMIPRTARTPLPQPTETLYRGTAKSAGEAAAAVRPPIEAAALGCWSAASQEVEMFVALVTEPELQGDGRALGWSL